MEGGGAAAKRLLWYVQCTEGEETSESLAMTTAARSARLGLRATSQQEAVLRRASEVSSKSMTDFILDSAYQVAERVLLDQRLFLVTGQSVAGPAVSSGQTGARQPRFEGFVFSTRAMG